MCVCVLRCVRNSLLFFSFFGATKKKKNVERQLQVFLCCRRERLWGLFLTIKGLKQVKEKKKKERCVECFEKQNNNNNTSAMKFL